MNLEEGEKDMEARSRAKMEARRCQFGGNGAGAATTHKTISDEDSMGPGAHRGANQANRQGNKLKRLSSFHCESNAFVLVK